MKTYIWKKRLGYVCKKVEYKIKKKSKVNFMIKYKF